MKTLEVLAALLAGAGAVVGQALESLGPLVAGLALAAACSAVVRLTRNGTVTSR